MADGMFDPVAGLIDPKTYDDISRQWSTFLDQPGGRAALLQAGIQMSQPLAWGQSNFGALTGALGSGGEALTRVEALDLKQKEAESKDLLRQAQADAAGSRAQLLEGKADTAAKALDIKQQGIQLRAWNDLRRGYETYRSGVEKSNDANRLLNPEAVKPPLTIEEWIRTQPSARAAAEASGLFGTTGVTAPGAYSTPGASSSGNPQDAAAREWLSKNPNHPDAPAVRQKLLGL